MDAANVPLPTGVASSIASLRPCAAALIWMLSAWESLCGGDPESSTVIVKFEVPGAPERSSGDHAGAPLSASPGGRSPALVLNVARPGAAGDGHRLGVGRADDAVGERRAW